MAKAWKIAPGQRASNWHMCRDLGCIVIGWRELTDYGKFNSDKEVLKALRQAYGRGAKGAGKGTAKTIWSFGHVIKPLDVVVANKGFSEIEGIGIVRSEYLAPKSRKNPSQNEWLPHARLVEWVIKNPVALNSDRFFAEPTVWPLDPSKCEEIRRAYVKKYPELEKKLADLFDGVEPHLNIDDPGIAEVFAGESDIEGLRSEYRATRLARSRRLRNKALRSATGTCAVCRRDFRKFLGGYGQRVLQVHHCKQLSAREVPSETKLTDLVVVCANCHLLLHLDASKTLTVDQLRTRLKNDGYLQS
jgi:predicted HNH restriction endonuclease